MTEDTGEFMALCREYAWRLSTRSREVWDFFAWTWSLKNGLGPPHGITWRPD